MENPQIIGVYLIIFITADLFPELTFILLSGELFCNTWSYKPVCIQGYKMLYYYFDLNSLTFTVYGRTGRRVKEGTWKELGINFIALY